MKPLEQESRFRSITSWWNALPEEAKQQIREKQGARGKVCARFVTRLVSEMVWDKWYSYHPVCCMGNVSGMIRIGYVTATPEKDTQLPAGILEMTDEELLVYDDWARSRNVYPFPLQKKEE